ncbi:hypothetical protein AYK26_04425 [Euryarchaeota archaeon SM23-78]|nr:MAG: hypothetical protein AYK26_04425 [Euryarchaeota archaeon SM23-78]
MLHTPTRDFFIKACMYAKENKMKELTQLEAMVMIAEEEYFDLEKKGIRLPSRTKLAFEARLSQLKRAIKAKKKEIY